MVDQTKSNIFVWVPGTGGHEVHPAFKAAAEKATKGDCQFICVDYPASVNFVESVQTGIKQLTKTLKRISNTKLPHQRVFIGGSSQGAWVIGDALFNDPFLLELMDKAILFGDPGISQSPDFHFQYEERVWVINNPNDAVTFGWDSAEKEEITRGLLNLYKLRPAGLVTLLKYTFKKPTLLWRLFVLTVLHTKVINWVTSPHDYSNQMPLAVYWMLH